MKKEILSEIYRIQEIMGFTKTLNEIGIPGLSSGIGKAIIKGADAELTSTIKSLLDTSLATGGKTIDNVYDDLITKLKSASTDNEVDEILNKFIKNSDFDNPAFTKIFNGILSSDPNLFVKLSLEANFGNRVRAFDAIIKSKNVGLQQAKEQFDILKNRVDELINSDDGDLIQMGTEIKGSQMYQDFEKKIDELSGAESAKATQELTSNLTPKTWEEWYNKVYLVDTKRFGKKAVSEEDFIAQARSIAAKNKGIPPEKVIEQLIKTAENKKSAIEYVTNFFKKNKVGDGLEATADGAIKVTEKGAKWLRTLGGIGIGGLLTTGILLAIFKPEFYVELAQKYREAGAKYNEQYEILLARFGQQFTDLPDEVKQFLSKEFTVDELKISKTNVYLKSFNFTPNSTTAAGLLVVTMSDRTTKEYETTDNKTFTQVKGTPGSGSSSPTEGSTKTKAEIIEKIKGEGFVDPIVLTPDEDNQPNYTFTAGNGGNGSVNVKDGNITVSIPD